MKKARHDTVQQPSDAGSMRTSGDSPLTVGDLRNAIAFYDDDVEITFGSTLAGIPLRFYRFKSRGDALLQIELNEDD